MDFLTVRTPEQEKFEIELDLPRLRIGRSSANDLILKDPNVSRRHAEIEQRQDGYYILDVGGKNGTSLNDRRISVPTLLCQGDRIRLGASLLVFGASAATNVEFSGAPLSSDSATTSLRADEVRSPISGMDVPSPAMNLMMEANEELVFHRPLDELLQNIMDIAGRAAPYEVGVLALLEDGELVPKVVRVPAQEEGGTVSISSTISDHVIHKEQSVLVVDALSDDRFSKGQSIAAQQIKSVMCVPLWNNRNVIGLIYADSRRGVGLYSQETLRVLTLLANIAAIKIENARLFTREMSARIMEEDLQKAAEIQRRLMPRGGAAIPGYAIRGRSVPCQAVGGDYFDYVDLPGGRFGIALGDVAGKGLPASLLMAQVHASVRALCDLDLPLEELVSRLNRLLSRDMPDNRYVTFFYGILDPREHTLAYVNAGHNPPIVVREAGGVESLAGTGPPIGLFADAKHRAERIDFAAGDLFVAYSDGVTEAEDTEGNEFGEKRLVSILEKAHAGAIEDTVKRVVDEVEKHIAGRPHQDDVTLLVLKRDA